MASEESGEPADTFPAGKQLGRYQIVRLMGHGGMASVYEGIHLDLRKRVAIKTLHPSVAASADARARFLREGEAASRIQHPNVVDVTDVGTADGTAYLVMEYLEGEDLAAMIERTGALPVAEALDVVLPVLEAIAVAHEEGVIHRDLKPGNVFMTRTRHGSARPTVLDFGISKLSSEGGNTLALTGTGAMMGTPYYVAPEQLRSAAGADGQSDQYALGAILYECLTGQRAHQGESIYDVIRSVGDGRFPPPRALCPDIPPALEQAILRAMELDPARRFPSVRAFGRVLLPFASPAARAHWTAAFSVGGPDGVSPSPSLSPSGPAAGGTMILPTPVPGMAARTPAGRSASASRSNPGSVKNAMLMSNTTLGSSTGQLAGLGRRHRAGLVVGGLGLAGGGVALYLLFAPTPRAPTAGAERPASDGVGAVAPRDPPRSPPRYRVTVRVVPDSARLDLDGKTLGTGPVDEELATDGVEHTLKVSAPGFRPATFSFRDRPPPSRVTLEPAPAPSPGVAAVPRSEARPAKPAHHGHEGGGHQKPHAPRPTKPPIGPDGAPIID